MSDEPIGAIRFLHCESKKARSVNDGLLTMKRVTIEIRSSTRASVFVCFDRADQEACSMAHADSDNGSPRESVNSESCLEVSEKLFRKVQEFRASSLRPLRCSGSWHVLRQIQITTTKRIPEMTT